VTLALGGEDDDLWFAWMYDSEKPASAVRAIELVDKGLVTKVVAEGSHRSFYLVQGNQGAGPSGGQYLVTGDHCTCKDFDLTIAKPGTDRRMCKHAAASQWAERCGPPNMQVMTLSEQEFALALTWKQCGCLKGVPG